MWNFFLNRKIRKAMAHTGKEFAHCQPPVADHFFYGMPELNPQSIALWYIFQTDAELEEARSSGLCTRLTEATCRHLEQLKYPADVRNCVCFASQETIDNTPGGPRMYFQ